MTNNPLEQGVNMLEGIQRVAKRVAQLHAGDADLVREGAKHHGVQVVERTLFEPLESGQYNPHLPTGSEEEAQRLSKVRKFVKMCMDYRQSGDVVSDPELGITEGEDAVWADAGGAAQPDQERFDADVDFVVAVAQVNPTAEFMFLVHDHVCGGANFYTKGEAKRVREEEGSEAEDNFMVGYGHRFAEAVLAKAPNANVRMGLAKVDDNEEYAGVTWQWLRD